MQITIKDEFFINGLRFQIHQAIEGVKSNQNEIISILTEAKQYQENRIQVREINRRYFSQVTFLSRYCEEFLTEIQDGCLPSNRELKRLISILEKF